VHSLPRASIAHIPPRNDYLIFLFCVLKNKTKQNKNQTDPARHRRWKGQTKANRALDTPTKWFGPQSCYVSWVCHCMCRVSCVVCRWLCRALMVVTLQGGRAEQEGLPDPFRAVFGEHVVRVGAEAAGRRGGALHRFRPARPATQRRHADRHHRADLVQLLPQGGKNTHTRAHTHTHIHTTNDTRHTTRTACTKHG
jgi:hypothetical protein